MERLRESWTFGSGDFQNRCRKLDESVYTSKYKIVKKLDESCDTNAILKVGLKLRESLADESSINLLDQILEALKTNGADNTFKVWQIPVAKYDHKNLNGRIYPRQLWQNILTNQQDAWKGLCGLADHPEGDDPGLFRDQAVVWHDMEVGDDGVVYGVCSFVGPYGHLAQEILEHGGRIGTSSSGFGDVNPVTRIVDPDTYQVERLADLVLNPSQGTYGSSADPHVSPKDFVKDVTKPAVMDFDGNKPVVHESVENNNNNNVPRSKILMAKANAVENNAATTENQTAANNVNKLSKVEEKAFRQYVEKFIESANNIENPLKRLNECVDILSCFEDGNCPDLKESVEKQIIAEKENLEKIVESTAKIQDEYGMTAEEFKEAAERNVKQGILLNEQITDYKALLEEMTERNKSLLAENQTLKEKLETQKDIVNKKLKETNKSIVETLDENDHLAEDVENIKNKNSILMERISKLNMANDNLEKNNGILETKLKEAASLLKNSKSLKENASAEILRLKNTVEKLNEELATYQKSNAKWHKLAEEYSTKYSTTLKEYASYKEQVQDMMDPTKHVMESASKRIGSYLGSLRENEGADIAAYMEDLKEQYGEAVNCIEDEVLASKTLREATNVFLKNRNKIFKEFEGTSPVDQVFRNEADKDRIYEQVGMLNPKESYKNASLEEKNSEFRKNLDAQGLL